MTEFSGPTRFNHVAMSMPADSLDEAGRADICRFYSQVFGWQEHPSMTEDRKRLVMGVHSYDQFVFLIADDEPMRAPRLDHFGLAVDSIEQLHEVLNRAKALAETDDRIEIIDNEVEDHGVLKLHSFYVGYLLPMIGEVTAIERGPMPTDDPDGIGLRNVTVTITISETLKGTAAGTTVVIGEAGYYNDGSTDVSYELADMPWSQLGDIGVFSLKHYDGQPANHFTHVHPDGRMLTHYRGEDGQSHMYEGTVETFSHTALGATLTELAPDRAAEHARQAALAVVTEGIEPQRPFYESIFEIESDDTSPGGINNTGSGTDSSVPVGPGEPGTTSEHAFCEQAEFFASRSVRDNDNHTSEIQSQSGTASLDALTKLRDLAPASLRADLDLLVAYEQSYDPANEEQPTSVEVSRAGERVGSAIEQRCDLQLPYVRSDS